MKYCLLLHSPQAFRGCCLIHATVFQSCKSSAEDLYQCGDLWWLNWTLEALEECCRTRSDCNCPKGNIGTNLIFQDVGSFSWYKSLVVWIFLWTLTGLFPLTVEMYPETAERFLYRTWGPFIPGIVWRVLSLSTLDNSSQASSISSVGVFLKMGLHFWVAEVSVTGD